MPTAPSNAPIFIVGHPRSGTTVLRLILDSHPRIVVPPEGHLVSFLRRAEKKFGRLSDDRALGAMLDRLLAKDRMLAWKLDAAAVRAQCLAGERTPGGVFRVLMRQWTERAGKPRWGEKTPATYRFLPDVNRWFPDAQVLHIIRDGRDVAVSCLTPPFSELYDKGNEYEVAFRWRDALQRGRRAAKLLGPERYMELRYEDLTADPEGVVRRVCAFLHEDFLPSLLAFHRDAAQRVPANEHAYHERISRAVDSAAVERWRADATEEFVLGFEGIAGQDLVRHGYRLSGYVASRELRTRVLLERLRPRRLIRNYKSQEGAPRTTPR